MKIFLAGLFILGILAYYLARILRKKKLEEKKQLELGHAYHRLVKHERISVNHSELLNGKVIALDRKNKKLLFIDHNHADKQEECIPLLGIESSRIIEVKAGPDFYTRKIFLELKHRWNNKVSFFCFYDDAYDSITDLPTLARTAKFWKHRIDLHKYPGSVSLELEYVL